MLGGVDFCGFWDGPNFPFSPPPEKIKCLAHKKFWDLGVACEASARLDRGTSARTIGSPLGTQLFVFVPKRIRQPFGHSVCVHDKVPLN